MHGNYFQGILQLRNPDSETEIFVETYHRYISKKRRVKNGFDYYFISNKIMRSIAKKMKERFGGTIKESPSLFSRNRQTQKAVYRLNILFRLFAFKKGDVIYTEDSIIKITNIGKKVSGIDLKTNKKKLFKNIKGYSALNVIKTRVVKVHPNIEVLDEDYQSVLVENKKKVVVGQKVSVVNHLGYWIV